MNVYFLNNTYKLLFIRFYLNLIKIFLSISMKKVFNMNKNYV